MRFQVGLLVLEYWICASAVVTSPPNEEQSAFEEASSLYDDFDSQTKYLYNVYCQQNCGPREAKIYNAHCDECFCDKSCQYYGDCCPDLQNITRGNTQYSTCSSTMFPPPGNAIKMVHRCPEDYDDQDLVDKCNSSSINEWRSIQPATDITTGVTYTNRHCARCHGAENPELWQVGVLCNIKPPWLPVGATRDEVFIRIVNTEGCKINMVPPKTLEPHMCLLFGYRDESTYTNSCNVTGTWADYDPLIERACLSMPINPVNTYSNLFCFMCNTERSWAEIKTIVTGHTPFVFVTELSVLLDLRDDEEEAEVVPNNTSKICPVFDPYQCYCRNVICANGKRYENGRCQSVYKLTNSVMYQFCLDLVMDFNDSAIGQEGTAQPLTILRDSIMEVQGSPVSIFGWLKYVSPCRERMRMAYHINTTVLFRKPVNTDVFEDFLVNTVPNLGRKAPNGMSFNVSYTTQCKPTGVLYENEDFTKPCEIYNTGPMTRSVFDYTDNQIINRASLILYKKVQTCPRVFIPHAEVTITNDKKYLRILANEKTLNSLEFEFAEEGGYFICVDDYIQEDLRE